MMLKVDQEKYSAALQKFLGYNKEEADFVACDYNNKAKQGLMEPLKCYPDPNAYYEGEYASIVGDNRERRVFKINTKGLSAKEIDEFVESFKNFKKSTDIVPDIKIEKDYYLGQYGDNIDISKLPE